MIDKIGFSAIQGLQRSKAGMVNSASTIARAGQREDTSDVTRAMVELKQHEQAAKANVKTLQTADSLLGSLLDVKA